MSHTPRLPALPPDLPQSAALGRRLPRLVLGGATDHAWITAALKLWGAYDTIVIHRNRYRTVYTLALSLTRYQDRAPATPWLVEYRAQVVLPNRRAIPESLGNPVWTVLQRQAHHIILDPRTLARRVTPVNVRRVLARLMNGNALPDYLRPSWWTLPLDQVSRPRMPLYRR
jgi:hypothetical protein